MSLELDVDADIFHDIVMSENISEQSGFVEGKSRGRQAGISEGHRLGWEKGASIGSEVGFYGGFAESLLKDLKQEDSTKPRVIKALERLMALVAEFPMRDPHSPDLPVKLEEIRTKFKQVCSLLGIKPEKPSASAEKDAYDDDMSEQEIQAARLC